MVLNKVGNVNNIYENKKSNSIKRPEKTDRADSIEISSAGLKAAEEAKYTQIIKETPDVRMEKVQKIKEMIADGSYDKFIDDEVLGKVADKLVQSFYKN